MNILNAVRGQPLARKTLVLSLLAALCTLHARTALPDTPPGTAPASVSEAAPDLTPLTSATSVPAPSDDGAGTLGASALQPGVSSILARLSPAIIYVPPVVTDPVDLAILDARKAMQANNLAAFDTAAALVPRGHALSSYLDYWRIRIRLAASDPTDAEYLAVSADAPGASGLPARLDRALVIGPLARLELSALEPRGQILEAHLPVTEWQALGLKEGDAVRISPRRARVFVNMADDPAAMI